MVIHLGEIIVILALSGVAWFANETLNRIPIAKSIVSVIVVVVCVYALLQSFGLISGSSVVKL